jgi:hypothetical protein
MSTTFLERSDAARRAWKTRRRNSMNGTATSKLQAAVGAAIYEAAQDGALDANDVCRLLADMAVSRLWVESYFGRRKS